MLEVLHAMTESVDSVTLESLTTNSHCVDYYDRYDGMDHHFYAYKSGKTWNLMKFYENEGLRGSLTRFGEDRVEVPIFGPP